MLSTMTPKYTLPQCLVSHVFEFHKQGTPEEN